MAADFLAYVNDKEYFAYVHKLYPAPPFWRPLRWLAHFLLPLHQRNVCIKNMPKAAPRLGMVLMGNIVLHDSDQAGPALVLTTNRFDFAGLQELYDVAERIEELRASPDVATANAVEAIYEDEDYQRFRRRALPACVNAPAHIQLFDELLTGNVLIRIDAEGPTILHPFIVLFATDTDNQRGPVWSSAVPVKITASAIEILLQKRFSTPPPLPRTAA